MCKRRRHKARNYRRPRARRLHKYIVRRRNPRYGRRKRNPGAVFAIGDRVRFTQSFAAAIGAPRRLGVVKQVREARSRQGLIQIVRVQWAARDVTDVSAYNLEVV